MLHQTSRVPAEVLGRWDEAMDVISEAAHAAYRDFVDHPGLSDFFSAATPVDVGRLTDPAVPVKDAVLFRTARPDAHPGQAPVTRA